MIFLRSVMDLPSRAPQNKSRTQHQLSNLGIKCLYIDAEVELCRSGGLKHTGRDSKQIITPLLYQVGMHIEFRR